MAETKNLLVIIPSPWLGHLIPTIEFANTLLARDHTFTIAVLLIRSPFDTQVQSFTNTFPTLHPSINFIHIPQVDTTSHWPSHMSYEAFASAYIELHRPNVKHAVEKLVESESNTSLRFLIDMFCTSMIDVADDFNSDCYTFFTCSASFLGLLQFNSSQLCFNETDDPNVMMQIQGYANCVPTSVLPFFFFQKDGREAFATHVKRIREETKGVIVNTFAELEEYALSSVSNTDGFPPLYTVGPLLDLKVKGADRFAGMKEAERMRVMRWLDEQEDASVVFLCFGSLGSFSADQLNEIAAGLENSAVKFLWSVRKPPDGSIESPAEIEDPSEILSEGFLARIQGRGLVCGWAPQTSILAHKAVGGFVTHCGWNSILESIWFGVPTAAWPQYAEQQINAFYMVKDLGLSIELKMDYRFHQEELVSAAEIETVIKSLMSSDGCGREMRKRVKEMSERSRAAVAEGRSSFKNIEALIKEMLDE